MFGLVSIDRRDRRHEGLCAGVESDVGVGFMPRYWWKVLALTF